MRFHNHLNFWFNYLVGNYPHRRVDPTADEIERIEHYCSANKWHLANTVTANSVGSNIGSGYRYDWYQIFDKSDTRQCAVKCGDVTNEFEQPTFTKSRPIQRMKNNNILLPLDSIRHLTFLNDETSFNSKKNNAVWRGACYQEHRKLFLQQCAGINSCDIADTSRYAPKGLFGKPKSYLSFKQQLNSKFIFAIEGTDVASNLKWVMGSNSIPVMPKPKYETWFCESKLIPGEHYIEIADDFSNTEEVIDSYLSKPKLCHEISEAGKEYAAPYRFKERQFSLAREVTERYFDLVEKHI